MQAAPLVVGGWNDPLVAFGPGAPVRPAPIDPLGSNGRPAPRRSDYQVSFNLPGSGERLVPWSILRQLADGVGIIRKCVEIRKKQITQLAWDFVPAESAFELLMLSQAATRVELDRAKKAAAGDEAADKQVNGFAGNDFVQRARPRPRHSARSSDGSLRQEDGDDEAGDFQHRQQCGRIPWHLDSAVLEEHQRGGKGDE